MREAEIVRHASLVRKLEDKLAFVSSLTLKFILQHAQLLQVEKCL